MNKVVASLVVFFYFILPVICGFKWLESNSFEFTMAMAIKHFSILLSFYRACCLM